MRNGEELAAMPAGRPVTTGAGAGALAVLPVLEAPLGVAVSVTPPRPAAPEAGQTPGAAGAPASVRGPQPVAALKELAALHNAGALNDSEFACAKARLLEL